MIKNIDQYELVSLEITKAQIENFDFEDILSFLQDIKEEPRKYFNKLTFSISGYDNDHRELYQITEVRNYLIFLDKCFPYWLFFLKTDLPPKRSILLLLITSVVESEIVSDLESHKTISVDMEHVDNFIKQRLPYFNEMMDKANISMEEQKIVFYKMINLISDAFK